MFDGSLMLQVNLPLFDTIHLKGNEFVTGVMIKAMTALTVFSIRSAFRAMERAWAWLTNLINCDVNFELYNLQLSQFVLLFIFIQIMVSMSCIIIPITCSVFPAYFQCSLLFPVCINCQSNKRGLASQKWYVHCVKLKHGGIHYQWSVETHIWGGCKTGQCKTKTEVTTQTRHRGHRQSCEPVHVNVTDVKCRKLVHGNRIRTGFGSIISDWMTSFLLHTFQ